MNPDFVGCASTARSTFPTSASGPNSRHLAELAVPHSLIVPLRQKGIVIGALAARRMEVRPFNPAQIKLLETFADQAVIAIENVRLFQELKESLEQQTATSEILGVIASSPTDIQPVLDTIAESAARICGADDAFIRLVEDNLSTCARTTDKSELSLPHDLLIVSRYLADPFLIDNSFIFSDLLAVAEDRVY